MVRIISERRRVEVTRYALTFQWRSPERTEAGFGFPCGADGQVIQAEMLPPARANLAHCLDGTFDVSFEGVRNESYSFMVAAVGECVGCHQEVELGGFTNTCQCGLDYNGSGQLLAPREQWGEETGETVADILSVDALDTETLLVGCG